MMSRMAGLVLIALAAPAHAGALEAYRDKTSAEPRCSAPAGGEIVVCGRREADKYRVPFIERTPGDPKTMGVPEERARLVAAEAPCQQQGPHLIGCGMVGVTVSTRLGGGKLEYRPLAP